MRSLIASALLALSVAASAAPPPMGDPAKVTLKTTPVAGGVSMIEGADGFAGGNVGVSVGDDGVFIIDDELQPMTPKLKVALAALSGKPVRFVINTHWHSDHTGGNGGLAAVGPSWSPTTTSASVSASTSSWRSWDRRRPSPPRRRPRCRW